MSSNNNNNNYNNNNNKNNSINSYLLVSSLLSLLLIFSLFNNKYDNGSVSAIFIILIFEATLAIRDDNNKYMYYNSIFMHAQR